MRKPKAKPATEKRPKARLVKSRAGFQEPLFRLLRRATRGLDLRRDKSPLRPLHNAKGENAAVRVRRPITLEAHEWAWLDAYAQRHGISRPAALAAAMAALERAEARPVKTAAEMRQEAAEMFPGKRPKVNCTAIIKSHKK